jgi:hypothetical protein
VTKRRTVAAVLVLGIGSGYLLAGSRAVTFAEPNPLPAPFTVGQYVKLGTNSAAAPLYEVKQVSGEWIRVVSWEKGNPIDEQRWIHVPTGTTWIHSK